LNNKIIIESPVALIACAKITRSLGYSTSYINELFNEGILENSIINQNEQVT
jgi:hypothetical protein